MVAGRKEGGRMVVGGKITAGEGRREGAAKAPGTATLSWSWLEEGEAAEGTQQRRNPGKKKEGALYLTPLHLEISNPIPSHPIHL